MADMISVPQMKYFANPSEFFRTIYHELGHNAASIIMPNGMDKNLISKELCYRYAA
jgi:antirestriction protein ArdC